MRSVARTYGPWIFDGEEFVEGGFSVEGGKVVEVFTPHPGEIKKTRIVFPLLANAHTHLGDAFIRKVPKGTVEDIVAPPSGYKFRMLAKASPKRVESGMARAVAEMARTGTCAFADFREGGAEGAAALKRAAKRRGVTPTILGRPAGWNLDKTEVANLLKVADGIGLSSISEWKRDDLLAISEMARRARKPFAIHASERAREPFGRVAELKPAFVVHMAKASGRDMSECAEAGIPVVVCPRSNAFFGFEPHVRRMLDAGIEVALGTDNAMLSRPDLVAEARFLAKAQKSLTQDEILRIAISAPRKVLNLEPGLRIKKGHAAEFASLPCGRGDPARAFVAPGMPTVVRGAGGG